MGLVRFVDLFDRCIGIAVTLLYFYQVIYLAVGLFRPERRAGPAAVRYHRYAALISARNEEKVIAELIASLKAQNYPSHLLDIYVVADNCTDRTAQAARAAGARVYRRFDRIEVG